MATKRVVVYRDREDNIVVELWDGDGATRPIASEPYAGFCKYGDDGSWMDIDHGIVTDERFARDLDDMAIKALAFVEP